MNKTMEQWNEPTFFKPKPKLSLSFEKLSSDEPEPVIFALEPFFQQELHTYKILKEQARAWLECFLKSGSRFDLAGPTTTPA